MLLTFGKLIGLCALGRCYEVSPLCKELGAFLQSQLRCRAPYAADGVPYLLGDVLCPHVGIVLSQVGELSVSPRLTLMHFAFQSENAGTALDGSNGHPHALCQCVKVAFRIVAPQNVVKVFVPNSFHTLPSFFSISSIVFVP